MTIKQKILSSIEPVTKDSKFVTVNKNRVADFAKSLISVNVPSWDNEFQFKGTAEQTVQYYFFVDSINFCFWPLKGKEKWGIERGGKIITGYYAYSYAIKKSIEENPRLLDASYLSNISYAEFGNIFKGRGKLQLLEKRWEIIRENFGSMNDNFGGQASILIRKAKKDVNDLIRLLLGYFPSFRDVSNYKRKEAFFLKRAQIFISDINYAMKNKGLGYFKNMDDLSIFADYKLPQLLQNEGILQYSTSLLEKIRNEELIKSISREEMEIRANTIFACELILKELQKLGRSINSNQLDWILWVKAKDTKFTFPHHLTLTIFY